MTAMCRWLRQAQRRATRVVVSIFVNPTQFAPSEDFGSYPRTWKADVAKLSAEKVALIWYPDTKTMYPDGFATKILTEGPATAGLKIVFVHSFSAGSPPSSASCSRNAGRMCPVRREGFQQLKVVTRMARDLDLGGQVIGAQTVRERDGLALSSRNVYLTPEQRRTAPMLYRAMKETAKRLRAGGEFGAAIGRRRAADHRCRVLAGLFRGPPRRDPGAEFTAGPQPLGGFLHRAIQHGRRPAAARA